MNQCKVYTFNSVGCDVYNPKANSCLSCLTGYLPNLGVCILNPTGIKNCRKYTSGDCNVCEECNTGFWLNGAVCSEVTTVVSNCETYSDATTCSECKSNHLLDNIECKVIIALDCLTASNPTTCASCMDGYELKVTGSNTNCVRITSITQCQAFQGTSCIECKPGFWLDGSDCSTVTDTILGCTYQDSATTCAKCNQDFKLSADAKTCTALSGNEKVLYSGCSDVVISNTPECEFCNYGYFFDTNICVECS
ncbi:MAG: hypothetical protein GY938_03005 [Ketobacter sp.]|nr:hypothetical protein [Ketobacter sp.]